MKKWEWYLLVPISFLVLVTTFFTRNLLVVIGLFIVVLILSKFSKNIETPGVYLKYGKKTQEGVSPDQNAETPGKSDGKTQ